MFLRVSACASVLRISRRSGTIRASLICLRSRKICLHMFSSYFPIGHTLPDVLIKLLCLSKALWPHVFDAVSAIPNCSFISMEVSSPVSKVGFSVHLLLYTLFFTLGFYNPPIYILPQIHQSDMSIGSLFFLISLLTLYFLPPRLSTFS